MSTADASRQALEASANGTVHALEVSADGSTLYLGGAFTEINGLDRRRVAAVDLGAQRVTDFAPQVDDMAVRALTTARDGSAVAIGGSFTSVGGQARPGLAVLDPSGRPGPAWRSSTPPAPRAGPRSTRSSPPVGPRARSWAWPLTTGASTPCPTRCRAPSRAWCGLSGAMARSGSWPTAMATPTTSTPPARSSTVYVASHAHDCSMIGGFPEQQQYWHAPAFSSEPVGEVGPSPVPGYTSHTGQPAAASLHFHPVFTPGSFTGMAQATWTVEGTDKYVVYGGEFMAVNGTPQQGLVRFARRDVAPNQEGPVDKGAAYRVSATSTEPGVVRLSIPANHDRDDKHLTYAVYRDPGPMGDLEALKAQQPVWTTEQDLPFWETTTYEVRDEVGAGSTHSYVVVVWDSWGAWTRSERVTVEAQGPPPGGEGDQGPQEEGGPPADDSGRQEQGLVGRGGSAAGPGPGRVGPTARRRPTAAVPPQSRRKGRRIRVISPPWLGPAGRVRILTGDREMRCAAPVISVLPMYYAPCSSRSSRPLADVPVPTAFHLAFPSP